MLKIITSLFTLLLLSLLVTHFWAISAVSLILLSIFSFNFLTTQTLTPTSITQILFMDSLSAPLIILTLWLAALMIIASYSVKTNKNMPKLFMNFIILLTLILLLTFMATHMIMFYIFFFEASLIPTMLLIISWGYQPERLQASMYLMLYTVTASLPLLISLLFLYYSPSNLSLMLNHWDIMMKSTDLTTMWWLITIAAFITKMPLYLFHLWLPKAHVEAPVAGSMILAGILLKLGSYGLIRLSMMMKLNSLISPLMISLSLWGATLTSMICLRQTDLKSLIAYSSISHMSLLMAGVLSSSSWGMNAALTMMLAHGLCSSSLFALANMSYETFQTRSVFLTKGLITICPTMSMWWFLNSVMNMAAPQHQTY